MRWDKIYHQNRFTIDNDGGYGSRRASIKRRNALNAAGYKDGFHRAAGTCQVDTEKCK